MRIYKPGELTFKEYCKREGVNYNIGNLASRFYDGKLYQELIAKWKSEFSYT